MKTKSMWIAVVVWFLFAGSVASAAERSVAELIADLKSTDTAARIQAISELGVHGERAAAAVAPLTALLKDQSAEVRAHAAYSLGQIGAAARPSVQAIAQLAKDPDAGVRRQAVNALIAIRPGPEVAVPLFIKLLEESDSGVKVRILNAIAEAGPQAMPALIEALKNDKAAYWACLILREIGPAGKDAIPELVARLKDDPRPEVRREVLLTLAAMERAAAPAAAQIAAYLDDEHASVPATYALARIGQMTPQIEAKVKSNAASSKDKMLATVSLWALAHVHPEDRRLLAQAVEQLIERLKDDDPYVRLAAARGLAALPSVPEITAPIFERALKDADETTLNHALDALARLGAPAVPKLITGLGNEKFRPHALTVLRQIGPPAAPATKALAELIDHADEDTARSAVLTVAAIGPGAKDAVPALIKALKQKDRSDARAVIYALGRIGPAASDAKSALTELLAGSDEDLALMSAWAIVKIDPSPATAAKAVPVLVSGLTAPQVVMRRGAAETLGEMGRAARTSVEALQRATKDDDKSVRDAAAAALTAIQR